MKRFVKVMALFALFLLALAVFDRLQSGFSLTGQRAPLTGFAVYETKQLTWDFDDTADYDFDSSLINISGGEAKLRLVTTAADIADNPNVKLPSGNNTDLSITEISDSKYKTAFVNVGDEYYVDKSHKATAIPAELQGMLWLKTQQSDHDSKKNISFATNRPTRTFVGYDKRKGTVPDWLQSWAYWGEGITGQKGDDSGDEDNTITYKLYYKDFATGTVLLGNSNKSKAMYIILLNNTGYGSSYEYVSAAKNYGGKLKTVSLSAEKPEGTSAKLQVRIAYTQEALGSAQWLGPTSASDYYTTQGEAVNPAQSSSSGWLQYKALLETTKPESTPTLNSVTMAAEKSSYTESAAITTNDYNFQKTAEVTGITADEALDGQSVSYSYSTNSGGSWTAASLNSVTSLKTDKIRLRLQLNSNTTHTPVVKAITANFKISICDEKWQQNYTGCSKSNTKTKYYTDANSCGSTEDLPADNGTAEACDYCTPQWANASSSCRNDDTIAVSYTYSNTCCQETGLASDCAIPPNTTATCDFCKPLWLETNGSCRNDDKITSAYSDANNCHAATGLQSDNNKPANKTYACDYCTPSFSCSGYGDCGEDNKKACTQVNDSNSCYGKTGLASDNYTGSYSEFSASCAFDSESPAISNVTAAVSGSTLTITASITDKSATTATAHLVKEGPAAMNLTLINTTKDTYLASASAAGLKGAYVIVIVAKDEHNNTARTKGIAGIAVQAEKYAEADVALNLSRKSVLSLTNTTTIELTGKAEQSATGRLIISEHKSDIRNATKPVGKRELQKYVEVEADEALKSNVSSATLRISYTDGEVLTANISEASLAMHFYNESSLIWQIINSTVDAARNYVEGNTTHLSLFGIFGAEQNQTAPANATANSTLTNATNATTTNQTATNQTAGTTVNETGTIPQQQTSTAAEAASGGGAGSAAGQAGEKTEAEKEEAMPAANATEADDCSYEVKVELAGKPSFTNTTTVNATLANTGTCALQGVEIKLTKPLDSYISVENGNAAELRPEESLAFALKLKAAASGEAQKQPLQGFAVKEPRKKAVHNGKIIITGHGAKGLGLDIEAAGPKLEKEVPMNIEIYELEQNGGKSSIAATAIGVLVLITLLGMLYSRIMRERKERGNGKDISGGSNDSGVVKEAAGKQIQAPEHEKEKLSFEEKLKSVAEKWDQRQQNDENSNSGSSEGEDKRNNKINE